MSRIGQAYLKAAAAADRVRRRGAARIVPDDLIREFAPSRSWADIGCMWNIDGRDAFLAEECGASAVTAFDAMEPTDRYRAEHERRESSVRFVHGDLHRRETLQPVGRHDVVWCSGVLYHTPFPALAVQHLCEIAGEYLILGNKTIPEIPGFPQAGVFYPGLSAHQARAYRPISRDSAGPPHDPNPFANWWYGLTRSATDALVTFMGRLQEGEPDWVIERRITLPYAELEDDYFVVARRVDGGSAPGVAAAG